jgi:hypothetical protein
MRLCRARQQPNTFIFRDPTPIPEYWSNLKSTLATIPSSNSTIIQGRPPRRAKTTSSASNQSLSHSALASGQLYNPYSFPNPYSSPFPFGVAVTQLLSRKTNTSQPEITYFRESDLRRRPCTSQTQRIPLAPGPRGILKKNAEGQNINTRRMNPGRHLRFAPPRTATHH